MSLSPQPLGPYEETPHLAGPTHWGYREVLGLAGLAVVSLLVLSLATGLLIGAYASNDGLDISMTEGPVALGAILVMQALWWAVVLWGIWLIVVRMHGWSLREGVNWVPFRAPWTLFITAGIGLAFMVGALSSVIPMPEEPLPIEALLSTPSAVLAMALFGVLIAPPAEELLFRGFLFAVLQRKHGGLLAVLGTAAPFALMHAQQYGYHWQILLILFVVGSALGWMRLETGSTIPSTIAHATYNLTLFLGLWFVDEEMIENLEQMEAALLWMQ